MGQNANPRRAEGLEIDEVGDGFIIYDPQRDRVHYLNHTAALVLELATGELDAHGIADWIGRAYSLDQPPVADIVRLIGELTVEGLLRPDPQAEHPVTAHPSVPAARSTDSPPSEGP